MQKLSFVLLMIVITAFTACKKEPLITEAECREIAWNALSESQQATVTIDYKTAQINEATYNGRNAFRVLFPATDIALLGPIAVYVYADTKTYAGQAIRY